MSAMENHLPGDPVQWIAEVEAIWQARDGVKAAEGYTEDAVLIWGSNRTQSGAELRSRPALWFAYAKDLKIKKSYVAHTNDCIVTTWESVYTNPESGKTVHERGIEYIRFRFGKICEQHAWQHSWSEEEQHSAGTFSTA